MKECCKKTLEKAIETMKSHICQQEEGDNDTMAAIEWQRWGINEGIKILQEVIGKK